MLYIIFFITKANVNTKQTLDFKLTLSLIYRITAKHIHLAQQF